MVIKKKNRVFYIVNILGDEIDLNRVKNNSNLNQS